MKRTRMKIKLDPGAIMPTRAHDTDAGLDLYAREEHMIPAMSSEEFDTGVHIALPPGTVGIIASKSGLNMRCSLTSEGVIDEGYTGSIRVKLYNHSRVTHRIRRQDKITQLLVLPCLKPELELVDELEETERGDNGFGSSGR